ncbi:hypothetical protein LOD99_3605 [Oopsacas minuta]|uniref:RETREG1-3/ARL6IP-like N-terminal reticulon-homology domain-containing protein n=1 Tax=Oopsacas minuta TaxID=111878 RepID=A0AAV7JXG3_9METZ|nr:hypothetical protein LOD99_3605 [Oopsacas minuta]
MATIHEHEQTPRIEQKEADILKILNQYYPEVQFFRKLLLFEYFPLTIMFYAIIHGFFYYISTTEDSLVSMLILFGVLGLVTWKVGMLVVLPTYLTARNRTMGKKGKTAEKLKEEDAYALRLAHRLAIIAINVEDIKAIMINLHSNEPVKFLCIMSTIGAIMFFIGNYVPGIVVAYIVVIFIIVWPILVHNRLPQALDGFYQVIAPHFAMVKERVVDKAKFIPHPKLGTTDIKPMSREELPTSILEQSLAFGTNIQAPPLFQQQYYVPRPQMMPAPAPYPYVPSQTYYGHQPTDQRYYAPSSQDSHLRYRTNVAPLAPNSPPASTHQRDVCDAMQGADEFGRPYALGDDEFEMVDGSQIPKNFDS